MDKLTDTSPMLASWPSPRRDVCLALPNIEKTCVLSIVNHITRTQCIILSPVYLNSTFRDLPPCCNRPILYNFPTLISAKSRPKVSVIARSSTPITCSFYIIFLLGKVLFGHYLHFPLSPKVLPVAG